MLPVNIGLSDESGISRVSYDLAHSGTSHIIDRQGVDSLVITSAWDDVKLFENIIGGKATYIKIDVEGMELKVIEAAQSFLRKDCVKMVVLEVDADNMSRYGSAPEQVYELFADMGFMPTVNTVGKVYEGHYDEIFTRDVLPG
jgi:Methyltransferase FkbM domain